VATTSCVRPNGKNTLHAGNDGSAAVTKIDFILRNRLSAGLKSDMLQSEVPFVNLSRKKEEVEP